MHRELPHKHLFIGSITTLLVAYLISTILLINEAVSVWFTFFFGIMGLALFVFATGVFIRERKKVRSLAAKELFFISIASFVIGIVMKGIYGGLFELLGVMSFLFSLTTLHREKTVRKR